MELLSKLKPGFWEMLSHKYEMWSNKFFTPSTTVCQNTGVFTFQPSKEFIAELKDSFTMAKIEQFENGPTYSAYHVSYFIGAHKGDAIYKTTMLTYPDFTMYDSVEEYRLSFF